MFIALAMSMLPTGMREGNRGSITPSQVITKITQPPPIAMAAREMVKAPGNPLARRVDMDEASTIMAARMGRPSPHGPRKTNSKTDPTATTWVKPRARATAVSLSMWIFLRRAARTMAKAAAAVIAACASASGMAE